MSGKGRGGSSSANALGPAEAPGSREAREDFRPYVPINVYRHLHFFDPHVRAENFPYFPIFPDRCLCYVLRTVMSLAFVAGLWCVSKMKPPL